MVEVDRTANRTGSVSLGQHQIGAADILGGRRVSIRIDTTTLAFFDPTPGSCRGPGPTHSPPGEVARLRGIRPAGPPPARSTAPVRVQRLVSATGTVMVARQTIALG